MGVVIAEVSVVPLGTADTALGDYVHKAVEALKDTPGLKFEVTPMCTVIEGELLDIMKVVGKMHEAPFEAGAKRVMTEVRIDDRRDKRETMERKVARALGE